MTQNKPNDGKVSSIIDSYIPDMFKDMFNNFKIPGLNLDQLAETTRANFESLMRANHVAASGLTEMGKRQAEIFRQTIDESMNIIKNSFEEVSHEQRLAKQSELAKIAFEKAIANAKELSEIASQSGKEASEIIQKRIKSSIDELQKLASQK